MLSVVHAVAMLLGAAAMTVAPGPTQPVDRSTLSPRLRSLGETCQTRRGISTSAFLRHLGHARRTQKAWTVAVVGNDAAARKERAEQIAVAAGATLHVVDADALVGKYIGETEKNLERLLGKAEADNVVLFFDEADALFGKRTGVRDAHDRYASEPARTLSAKLAQRADLIVVGTRRAIEGVHGELRAEAVVVARPKPPKGAAAPLPWHRLCWPPR